MKRRSFIKLAIAGGVAWPVAAGAQQDGRIRRIGVLSGYSQNDREGQARVAAFLDTFRKLGWADGRNVAIEYRWAAQDIERAKTMAAELLRQASDVILVNASVALAELQRQTSTVPIVFVQVSDSVGSGFVAGLARPGGNITGFENFEPAIGGKWIGVLKEAAPTLNRVAMILGSDGASNVAILHGAQAIGPSLGVKVTAIDIHGGIEGAIAAFAGQPDGGLIVVPHYKMAANRGSIIVLAARHRLPAIYPYQYYATEGGLISYGPDQLEQWRGAATYVDRILRGEKPGELPVQAPAKYELVINLKTAKALGIEVPTMLLARADEVIE